jgi:hypothetical protein
MRCYGPVVESDGSIMEFLEKQAEFGASVHQKALRILGRGIEMGQPSSPLETRHKWACGTRRLPRPDVCTVASVAQDLLSFAVIPGRCFRMIQPDGGTHPDHCREPVAARGKFKDGSGKVWTVDACESHARELAEQPSA